MDYIYQELEPAQAEAFEAALDKCPECKEKLEAFQRTRAAMRELDDLAPPPSVAQLLLEEAARATPAEKIGFGERLRRMMRVFIMHPAIAAAATLVVVLGVSFVVYRNGMPPAHKTPMADSPLPAVPPSAAAGSPADERKQVARQQQRVPGAPQSETTGAASPDNAAVRAGVGKSVKGNGDGNAPYQAAGPVRKRAHGVMADKKLDDLAKTGKLAGKLRGPGHASDGFANGKRGLLLSKNKDGEKATSTVTLRSRRRAARKKSTWKRPPPSPTPRRQLYRRTRRRAANAADVGGGSAGVWGGRSRYRYQQQAKPRASKSTRGGDDDRSAARVTTKTPAPVTSAAQPKAQAQAAPRGYKQRASGRSAASSAPRHHAHRARRAPRRDQKRAYAEREAKKVKKKKERDVVSRLLAEGRSAARRGDCHTAFARFNEAMRRRSYVIGAISAYLGKCYKPLLKSKRYRVLAQRVTSVRNPRQNQYRSRKRAAPAKAKVKPAKK